jgi:hypothetical protein
VSVHLQSGSLYHPSAITRYSVSRVSGSALSIAVNFEGAGSQSPILKIERNTGAHGIATLTYLRSAATAEK